MLRTWYLQKRPETPKNHIQRGKFPTIALVLTAIFLSFLFFVNLTFHCQGQLTRVFTWIYPIFSSIDELTVLFSGCQESWAQEKLFGGVFKFPWTSMIEMAMTCLASALVIYFNLFYHSTTGSCWNGKDISMYLSWWKVEGYSDDTEEESTQTQPLLEVQLLNNEINNCH